MNRTNLYSNLTRLLLLNYRENPDTETEYLSFPEFVRFIVNGTVEGLKGESNLSRVLQSESPFVCLFSGDWHYVPNREGRFWIRDANLNAHWLPYWRLCSPCSRSVRPDAVIKLGDSVRQEADLVFGQAGVYQYFLNHNVSRDQLGLPWANPSKEGRAERLRNKYFAQLTKSEVRALYHKYRVDHEMFGYHIEPYLSIAKDLSTP